MVANGREYVENFTFVFFSIGDAVRCEQRQTCGTRNFDRALIDGFLVAIEMALEFDINVFTSENIDESGDRVFARRAAAVSNGLGERTVLAAGQANQTFGIRGQLLFGNLRFPFRR